jgi:hypothetical protein
MKVTEHRQSPQSAVSPNGPGRVVRGALTQLKKAADHAPAAARLNALLGQGKLDQSKDDAELAGAALSTTQAGAKAEYLSESLTTGSSGGQGTKKSDEQDKLCADAAGAVQLMLAPEEEEPLQGKGMGVLQRVSLEEEEPLQG